MTREDATEIWLPIIKTGIISIPECYEAIDMAITALEQEPCGDAISRQAAIDACLNGWNKDYKEIVEEIRALPPVTAEKTGHWIDHQEDRWIYAKCSECGTVHDSRTNHCPNCGSYNGGEQNV